MNDLNGLGWLVILLPLLLLIQRQMHRELQEIFLILSGRLDIALILFSIVFFPGVFLHETSHYLAARLLGVPTGRFSILPQVKKNKLQLGYVETAQSDMVREALIGLAPLLSGCGVVVYVGIARLGLVDLWNSLSHWDSAGLLSQAGVIYRQPDFWLWFYLLFTVSSTMFPSRSDQRAWLPLAFFTLVLGGIGVFSGAGEWMFAHLKPMAGILFTSLASIFAISLLVHLIFYLPFLLIGRVLRIIKPA